MRVLVTGGAGFIGSNVVAALEERGDGVVVVDDLGTGDKWRNLARRRARLDLWSKAELRQRLESGHSLPVDAVVHMGAISSPACRDVDALVENNLNLSKRLWGYCELAGIPFVYASSAAIYGNGNGPLTPYGWLKLQFDHFALYQAIEGKGPARWTGLRLFNVYGPNEYHKPDPSPIATWWRENRVTIYVGHEQPWAARDFVWVGDVVDVVLWALDSNGSGVFDVGTGWSTDWSTMAAAFDDAHDDDVWRDVKPYPADLLPRYQWATKADGGRLRRAGYRGVFLSPEEGVEKYITEYLATGDPYR